MRFEPGPHRRGDSILAFARTQRLCAAGLGDGGA